MRTIRLSLLSFVFYALVPAYTASAQGLYWESASNTGSAQNAQEVSRGYAMPKMMKIVRPANVMIIRLDREVIYSIDIQKKSYMEMTFAEMEQWMQGASSKMDEVKKQLAQLPPEQRRMIEQQMGRGVAGLMMGESKPEVIATGESKTVSGYPCVKYELRQNGEAAVTAWTTKEIRGWDAFSKDWGEVYRRVFGMNPQLGAGLADAFLKIEGFPMEMQIAGIKTVVQKVEPRAIPPSEFEVPAGFAKQKGSIWERD
jgi:hypothetical protein